jgi:hypothetical protein
MAQETKKRYNIVKTYQPDDIPLHVRYIVDEIVGVQPVHVSVKTIEAANYLLIPCIVNALAGEWVQTRHKKSKEIEQLMVNAEMVMPTDTQNLLKKYRDYLTEDIYYECSIADIILYDRTSGQPSQFETELNQKASYNLPVIFPMKNYFTKKGAEKGVLTSLVGWEFLLNPAHQYPEHLTVGLTYADNQKIPVISEYAEEYVPELDEAEIEITTKVPISIPVLPSKLFLGMKSLKKLSLKNLGIETIAPDAFYGLPDLHVIILTGNNIKTIPGNLFEKTQVNKVELSQNPIHPAECKRLQHVLGKKVVISCGN